MSMSALIQSRQPNRGSFIDLGLQTQLGMRRQCSERFYDTQMLTSSPLFVKLSGHWGIKGVICFAGAMISISPLPHQRSGNGKEDALDLTMSKTAKSVGSVFRSYGDCRLQSRAIFVLGSIDGRISLGSIVISACSAHCSCSSWDTW
jgi:hypothetical protein